MKEEWEASARGAYRTKCGIDQGILAPLAIALTLLIGAIGRCSAMKAHAAVCDVRLTDFVAKAMEEASIPGAIIGIWQDGEFPYVRAFGVRDTATGEPMAADLHMRIGSVTKTFVTTAILQLVDQGKVGLDDPKRRYTPQDLLEIVVQHPPEFPADTKFDYNNSNTVLLGLVVEKVSGQPLNRYIDEHIVQAEHLQHTVFPADATLPSPHAHGYTKTTDGKIVDATDWNPSWGWAAGQMVSTVDDLHIWARDLATGKLLTPAAQREREKFQLAPSEGDGALYGLGVEYQFGWIGHNGNITGYQTYAYYLPSEKATMVVMVNSNADAVAVWNFVRGIVKIITPDHPWPAPPSGE